MPFIGKQPQAGAYSKLDAITTSATATYNLTLDSGAYYPQSANHLLVSLNGVIQAPQDSFTVSGSQIIFDSALTSSDVIDFIIALGDTLDIGVPSAGSVNTSQLANDAVTSAKLDTNIDIAGTLDVTGNTTLDSDVNIGTVGTIGTSTSYANQFEIKSTSSNLILNANNSNYAFDSTQFYPLTAGRSLGLGSNPFNNLYLSGGMYVGGTGSANYLDDYEEGTYTPVLASTGCTFSYSVQLGSYVKIGNLVYLQFNITLSNRTGTLSNTVIIDNIPFNTKNVDNSLYSGGHIGHYFNVNLGSGTTMAYQIPAVSTNQIELKEVGDNLGENGIVASELNTNAVIRGSIMYRSV